MQWQSLLGLALFCATSFGAQTRVPTYILDWVEIGGHNASFFGELRQRLEKVSDFFEQVTSPDIPSENRRLWIVSVDGKTKCLLSDDNGVSEPRWGAADSILYLMEADTNKDGSIDFRDDLLVRVISTSSGRGGVTLGQGSSAVWSPDGQQVAVVRDGQLEVMDLKGDKVPLGSTIPEGKIIVTNNRSSARARQFWAVNTHTGNDEELPDALREKYLWLGRLSPSEAWLVYTDAMKSDIFLSSAAGKEADRNLTNDRFLDLDPAWSPDEKYVIYVSDSPLPGPRCGISSIAGSE